MRKSITGKKSRASCLDKLEQLDKEPTLDTISECETSDEDLFNSTVKRSSKAVIKSDTEDEQDTLGSCVYFVAPLSLHDWFLRSRASAI